MMKLRPWVLVYLAFIALLIIYLFGGIADAHVIDHDDYTFPDAVERWRPLVVGHFEAEDVHMMLHILDCESNGDPNIHNPTSRTTGLFQHHPKYWHDRAQKAGIHPADAHDPHTNIQVAAWLLYENGGTKHWPNCGPSGWKWEIRHG